MEYLFELGMPQTHDDMEYIEHRVYHDYVDALDYERSQPEFEQGNETRSWSPYEQDLSQYPEVFQKYQENYDRYDKVKERFDNEDPHAEPPEHAHTRRLPKDMAPWESKYNTVLPRYTGT